jgi:nucleoside 2-deoxyribosyltransferase
MKTIYLAGPDVFESNSDEIGERKKHLCANYGFIGLYPSDNELQSDKDIFAANMKMISEADCGIFNLTPFRGPSADVGTVFELGVMVTLGKPVFGYTNSMRDYATRCRQAHYDRGGMKIEDFGNCDNLMIDNCFRSLGKKLIRGGNFVDCLVQVRQYFQ